MSKAPKEMLYILYMTGDGEWVREKVGELSKEDASRRWLLNRLIEKNGLEWTEDAFYEYKVWEKSFEWKGAGKVNRWKKMMAFIEENKASWQVDDSD
jgi:hypothetical protein